MLVWSGCRHTVCCFFFFKQKTAYEMRISDWSSDVCSSDLDWLRQFQKAKSIGDKLSAIAKLTLGDVKLYIPAVTNRTTGLSMGEHTEDTAKQWQIGRAEQDAAAPASPPHSVPASRTEERHGGKEVVGPLRPRWFA